MDIISVNFNVKGTTLDLAILQPDHRTYRTLISNFEISMLTHCLLHRWYNLFLVKFTFSITALYNVLLTTIVFIAALFNLTIRKQPAQIYDFALHTTHIWDDLSLYPIAILPFKPVISWKETYHLRNDILSIYIICKFYIVHISTTCYYICAWIDISGIF